MAIKVIAQRREVKLGKNPGMKFVQRPRPTAVSLQVNLTGEFSHGDSPPVRLGASPYGLNAKVLPALQSRAGKCQADSREESGGWQGR